MLRRVVAVSLSLVAAGSALWVVAAAISDGGDDGRARAALLFLAAAAAVGIAALVLRVYDRRTAARRAAGVAAFVVAPVPAILWGYYGSWLTPLFVLTTIDYFFAGDEERWKDAFAPPPDSLVAAARDARSAAYGRAVSALEARTASWWLEFDAERTRWARDVDWRREVERGDASTLLLVLAATTTDGRVREAATLELARRRDPIASTALAIRTADHVPQVRAVARDALLRRSAARDAALIVPILAALSERVHAFLDEYLDVLPDEVLRTLVDVDDRRARRAVLGRADLPLDALVSVARRDNDRVCRDLAARRALPAAARELLTARAADVRAIAIAAAADDELNLERLLLDRHASVRRAAQRRAGGAGAFYRGRLPHAAAALGLGETGKAADADLLLPLVDPPHPRGTRRAATRALVTLAPERVDARLVQADVPGVAREAARALARTGRHLTGADLDAALGSPNEWTRRAALRLARGWDVPIAALALGEIDAVSSWLHARAPRAGAPTARQRELLGALAHRLPPDAARELRFHAAL